MTEGWPPETPTIKERLLADYLAELERRAIVNETGARRAGQLDVIDDIRSEFGLPDQ